MALSKLNREVAERELNDILDYWLSHMVDEENGGFFGRIDGRNQLHPTWEKGSILNARILWTFSAATRALGDSNYRAIADRAYHYFIAHFLDARNGGVYWMLDFKGQPVDRKKQVYAQAFAIYGLSEYYKINPLEEVLALAIQLFELLEVHAHDSSANGYFEAFDENWEPLEDVRLSDKDMNSEKTMNTHLHILEAYTNLYRIWPSAKLHQQLENLIWLMREKFVSDQHHFHLFFDANWNLQSHEVSFGHDIEGSWLLHEAVEVLGDEEVLVSILPTTIKMTEAALRGMDVDGGLMNEADPKGLTDTDKHWWPQAEALVGLVNAWQVTGSADYLAQADQTWQFIETKLKDPDGEWYWLVSRSGEVSYKEDKAGPWKCPYHNGRAMIELLERLPN